MPFRPTKKRQQKDAAVVPTSLADSFSTAFDVAQQSTTLDQGRRQTAVYDNYIEALEGEGVTGLVNPFKRPLDPMFPVMEDEAIAQFHERVGQFITPGPNQTFELKTHNELMREVRESKQEEIEERIKASEGERGFASGTAKVGGYILGAMADPFVIYTLPFGALRAQTVLQTALTEARIGIASEAVIQGVVQSQRTEIGEEPDLAEAVESVALVGAGAGVLGGAIKAVGEGIGAAKEAFKERIRRKKALLEATKQLPPEKRTATVKAAEEVLEKDIRIEESSPYHGEKGLKEHVSRVERASELIQSEEVLEIPPSNIPLKELPPESSAIVRGLEASDIPPAIKDSVLFGRQLKEIVEASEVKPIGDATVIRPDEGPGEFLFHITSSDGVDSMGIEGAILPRSFVGEHVLAKPIEGVPLQERLLMDFESLGEVFAFRVRKDAIKPQSGDRGEIFTSEAIPVEAVDYLDTDGRWVPLVDPERAATVSQRLDAGEPVIDQSSPFKDVPTSVFSRERADIVTDRLTQGQKFINLRKEGFAESEIEAMEAAGLATDGVMDTDQAAKWALERNSRITSVIGPGEALGRQEPPPPVRDAVGGERVIEVEDPDAALEEEFRALALDEEFLGTDIRIGDVDNLQIARGREIVESFDSEAEQLDVIRLCNNR